MPPKPVKKIELLFKQILRFPFLVLLSKGKPSKIPADPEKVNSILILRPDKLGDMVVTIPVIHALKEKYPHIRIEVMASPHNVSIIKNDPNIDQIHLYVKNIFKDWPMMSGLKKKNFDIVYDPICHDSITGLLMTKIIGHNAIHAASRKLEFKKYYDYCRPYQPEGNDHNIDNGLLLFDLLGMDASKINPYRSIFIPDSSNQIAEKFWAGRKNNNCFWTGLNISAGSDSRMLPNEKYQQTMDKIKSKYADVRFVIFSTMADREKALAIQAGSKAESVLIPENLSLLDVSALMRKLNMLISPDTSMIHIARLMQIPVVGLYSGHIRNLQFWRPYRQEFGIIVADNINNLFDIEPDQIVEQFGLLLKNINRPETNKII